MKVSFATTLKALAAVLAKGSACERGSLWRLCACALFAALALGYGLGVYAVMRGPYAPVGSDEYHYLLEAKSAYENRTWHSPFTLWERVAQVGDFGFHGFLYNALHGYVARIFGYRPVNLVLTNVALLAAAIVVLFVTRTMPAARAALAACFVLGCFAIPVYTFTFMQENLHVLFAVIAWAFLQRIAHEHSKRYGWISGYYAFVALATLFRPQWALWGVATVPLARSWRELAVFLGLAVVGPLYAYLTMHWFCAPYPLQNWFFQEALRILRTQGVAAVIPAAWARFSRNVQQYFVEYRVGFADFWIKYVFIGLLAYLVVEAVRRRHRLVGAVALTAVVNLLVLWGAFDALWWTDHRMLCASFVAMLVALGAYGRPLAHLAVGLALIVLLPDTIRVTHRHIAERQRLGQLTQQWHEKVTAFGQLAEVITNRAMTTVLVSSKLYQHYDVVLPALPVRNAAGYPIRYTVNLYHQNDFQRFGLLPVSYVLTGEALTNSEYALVHRTPHYWLYRVDPGTVARRPQQARNLVRNGAFAEGLRYWNLMGETNGIRVVRVSQGEPRTWLRIENPHAVIKGVRQSVPVVSGAVYRLSGRVRSCAGYAPVLFGARICWEARPQPPHQLIWMTEYDRWWEKELIITSDVTGEVQIEATMGYGQVGSTGEFTDIKLECLGGATASVENAG